MRHVLASELNVLANRLDRLSERNWQTRDFTLNSLREALSEVAACFPVYRTYLQKKTPPPKIVTLSTGPSRRGKKKQSRLRPYHFDFLQSMFLPRQNLATNMNLPTAAVDFAMRFQQFTAPVMAKGMEDTAFYIFNRLVSQNEVGGDPRGSGPVLPRFHRFVAKGRNDGPIPCSPRRPTTVNAAKTPVAASMSCRKSRTNGRKQLLSWDTPEPASCTNTR